MCDIRPPVLAGGKPPEESVTHAFDLEPITRESGPGRPRK